VNLFVVAIVLAMFTVATSPFQTVVISALVLIYFELRASTDKAFLEFTEARFAMASELMGLAKLLHGETAEKQVMANVAAYQETMPRYYITVGFRALIWLIVVWKLLAVTILA
jgi:hypothetical protein